MALFSLIDTEARVFLACFRRINWNQRKNERGNGSLLATGSRYPYQVVSLRSYNGVIPYHDVLTLFPFPPTSLPFVPQASHAIFAQKMPFIGDDYLP
jgi:hypothetical protein